MQEIDIKTFQIDNEPIRKITKKNFRKDTITVKSKRFGNKVEVITKFDNSDSNLLTELYYNNKSLILVRFIENSEDTIGNERLAKINEYYYENKLIFNHHYSIRLTSHAMCMGIPNEAEWYEDYGFNENLDDDFLEKYADFLVSEL